MSRLYIDNDMARFTRKDITLVDMELYDGRMIPDLEPRRLFPLTGLTKYIALLDSEGVERAIIRNLATLPDKDRKIIEDCLEEYYLIPKVTKIIICREKFGLLTIETETDKGPAAIEIRNIVHGIKLMYGTRVLFRDNNDNRYEIPDLSRLDKDSRTKIEMFL